MALGGCSSVDIVDIMQKMRQDLTSLEVVIKAERVKDFPRVFTKADLEFVVGGEGLTEANLERAVALSMEKYCSVAAILRKSGCEITYSHKLAPAKPQQRAEPDRAL